MKQNQENLDECGDQSDGAIYDLADNKLKQR